MMRRAGWGVLAVVSGCSQLEQRDALTPDRQYKLPSSDRSHPTELVVDDRYGRAEATATGPGEWWYRVRFKAWPDALSTVTVATREVAVPKRRRADCVRVDVFDGDSVLAGSSAERAVTLGERPDPIAPLLVRVTTTDAARFVVSVDRKVRVTQPPRPPPPCDVHHLDASNPSCAGVLPHCDLDNPDFKNPDCCQADCALGAHRCRAKILEGGPSAASIAIGKSRHIMNRATGILYQRGKAVSQVLVLMVKDDWSFVQIFSPQNVDAATLVENGEVVLLQPEACHRR